MAFNPYSGSSANFWAVVVPPTSGSDLIIYGAQVPVPVYESVKYDFKFQLASTGEFVGFNSTADADTRALFTDQLVGGVIKWSVTVEGGISGDAVGTNSYTRFKQGQFLRFHMIQDRSTGFGFRNLLGKVVDFSGGPDTNSNNAQPLRLEIKGSGALTAPNIT